MMSQNQFTEVYDEHANSIFRYGLFKLHSREDALELVQDTFIRAWDYLNSGKEVENMKALLYKIANHLIIDLSRKKHRQPVSLESLMEKGFQIENPKMDLSTDLQGKLDSKIAIEMVQHLRPKYKDVILLRYVEELSILEIAETLRINKNIVSVRLNRALKQLNKLIPQ